ncbi:MAG: LysM peptidoglycan-binding domain-containing protein [Hyphomicrobiales bacterium]
MTFPADQDDLSAVCPYLGLADDADSHATYATEAHRCYRLENPTRIATGHQEAYCLGANHLTCPVYRGEGIGATTRAAAGAPPPPPSAPRQDRPPRGRQPRERSGAAFGGSVPGPAGQGRSPALERKRPAGTLGPRPRPGGISMPVATIGLFALAIVVLGLAFLISNAVGGGDDDDLSQAELSGTQLAQRSATGAAAAGTQTQVPGTQTNNQTPGAGATTPAGNTTPGGNGGGGGEGTYTVVAGDSCGAIATKTGVTVERLMELNPDINAECTNLAIGDVLKLR